MKKLIAIALVLMSLVLVLVSCGNDTPAPVDEFTINSSIYVKATDATYDELVVLAKSKNYTTVTAKDGYYVCEMSYEMYQNEYSSAKVNIAYTIDQLAAIVPTVARYRISDDLSTVTIATYDGKWDRTENGKDAVNILYVVSAWRYRLYGTDNATLVITNFTTGETVQTISINK